MVERVERLAGFRGRQARPFHTANFASCLIRRLYWNRLSVTSGRDLAFVESLNRNIYAFHSRMADGSFVSPLICGLFKTPSHLRKEEVRRMNGANGMSDIEGKVAQGSSERVWATNEFQIFANLDEQRRHFFSVRQSPTTMQSFFCLLTDSRKKTLILQPRVNPEHPIRMPS